jgi:hypothetical protein
MNFRRITAISALILSASPAPTLILAQNAVPTAAAPVILHPADLTKILPNEVFFRGQTATLQARNSGGVRWPGDFLTFAAMVDTSGYSSALQQKYQIYLITEVPLVFAGKQPLPAGAYGVGFEDGGGFVVMDLGGHDLFTLEFPRDTALKRPMPLEIMADTVPGSFRLYSGRNYISFSSAAKP